MIGEKVLVNSPLGIIEGIIIRKEKSRKYKNIYVVKTKRGILYVLSKEIRKKKHIETRRYLSENPKAFSNSDCKEYCHV